MTPLLLLFKMEPTCDSLYKQRAVIEVLVEMKETVGDIRKRLSSVYGNVTVDRSTVHRWAKRMKNVQ